MERLGTSEPSYGFLEVWWLLGLLAFGLETWTNGLGHGHTAVEAVLDSVSFGRLDYLTQRELVDLTT